MVRPRKKNCLFPLLATKKLGSVGQRKYIYDIYKFILQFYTQIYVIQSRYYDMVLNQTFQCLILTKINVRSGLKNRVGPGKKM